MNNRDFLNKPSKESAERQKRAFDAALAYEKNCILKYDRFRRPSLPPKKGDSMSDYAAKYGTTVKEMKDFEHAVEKAIAKGL